ncbi:MAG: polysaccharide biosynthesis protein [Megasphaera sp.]|jgi:stage V sporulation protein B|nr:polysaccharide biosynthesis protein [Megasphaera sp.]MCH4187318.1 polysaccharide biosynthesis protein [Megasphaera sp.]MCH4217284.1 polysaccharide biosynthesis protein [Megasphaera sp.]
MANKFVSGTLILTLSGFVVKAIGSINWIILSRILGGEGIGIYQMAFPIYLLALEISSAGIPIAISIITAEKAAKKDYGGAQRIFHVSLTMLCSTALFLSIVVFFGSRWLIDYGIIRESRAYYSLIALAPAIFFTTIIAGYRGYLQGWQQMTPTALSQIVEQLVRVFVMLGFAALLLPYGLDYAAGGASLGAGAGGAAALLVLLYYYHKLKCSLPVDGPVFPKEGIGHILKRLVILAIPISLASIMLPVVSNLDLLIVPRRLEVAGYSTAQATELFGYLTGMSVPLINLATILTAAMAMSLVPAISHSFTLHENDEIHNRTAGAMRIALLVTIPFSVMLYVMAEPVVTLIYNAPAATDATRAVSIAICFLGLHQITTAILQGLKKPKIPVINMGIACVFKVACNWFLVAIPAFGITGASYATVADIGVAAALNLFFIYRNTGYVIDIKTVLKNVISAVLMGIAMYFAYDFLKLHMGLFLSLFITCIMGSAIYIGLMIANGGVTREDAGKIPFFGRFF